MYITNMDRPILYDVRFILPSRTIFVHLTCIRGLESFYSIFLNVSVEY